VPNLTLERWNALCAAAPGVPRRSVRRWLRGRPVLAQFHAAMQAAAYSISLTAAEAPDAPIGS
jgi:hypothetical protein